MEIILKQRIVGSIVIVAILSIVLPFIVISKDEVFNKKLISNIPSKPVYKISLPESNYDRSGLNELSGEVFAQAAVEDRAQKSDTEGQNSDPIADNGARQQNNKNPLSANSATTKNETQNTKRNPVALFIPLTDQKSESGPAVKSLNIANGDSNENSSANNVSKDNSNSSSKLVASAPKGELTLPDLVSISKVLKDFIRQDSSSEPRASNANDSKNENKVTAKSATANKTIANTSVEPLEQSKSVSRSTKSTAAENKSSMKADKKLANLQIPSRAKPINNKSRIINKGWVVQVGSFSKKSNATKLQSKLSKRGHKSYVELAKSKNGIIYRVRVGPQKNQTRAKLVQRKILKQEKLESIVLRYPR